MSMIDTNHGKEKMKRIKEYQMMLNENRIPYLETQKSFLCESKCNSPANVAEIMESCFRISDLPEEHIYAIALNTKNQITGIFEVGKGTVNCSLISIREILIRMLSAGYDGGFCFWYNYLPDWFCLYNIVCPFAQDISLSAFCLYVIMV